MKKHLFMIFAVLLVAFVIMGCSTNKTVTYKIDKRTVLTGKLITPKEFPYKVQSGILITGLEGEYVIESHNNELDKKLFNSKLVDAWNADADIYWWSRISVWELRKNEKNEIRINRSDKKIHTDGTNRDIVKVSSDMIIGFSALRLTDGSDFYGNNDGSITNDYWLIYPVGQKKVDIEKQNMYVKPGSYKVGVDIPEGKYVLVSGLQNPKSYDEIDKMVKSWKNITYSAGMVDSIFNRQFQTRVKAHRIDKNSKGYWRFKEIKEYSQKFKGKVPLILDKRVIPYFSFDKGLLSFGEPNSSNKLTTLQNTDGNGKAAAEVLISYYSFIQNKKYGSAFDILDNNMKQKLGGYDKYVSGFKTTLNNYPAIKEVISNNNGVTLRYSLFRVDMINGQKKEQEFYGITTLKLIDGSWKIVDSKIK